MNIFQVIVEVAKHRALSEDTPDKLVYKDPRWHPFTAKLIKWICLCECYPYRMSLLVLIITDFAQKGALNAIVEDCRLHENSDGDWVQWFSTGDGDAMPTATHLFTVAATVTVNGSESEHGNESESENSVDA